MDRRTDRQTGDRQIEETDIMSLLANLGKVL